MFYYEQKIQSCLLIWKEVQTCHTLYFTLNRGHREGGLTARSKILKMQFLREMEKSFQEVTPIVKPHFFFLFLISQQIRSLAG